MKLPLQVSLWTVFLPNLVTASVQSHQSSLQSRTTPSLPLPIAAAWFYMSDDQNYTTIPSFWSSINFAVADVLYLAPVGVQSNGKFGLYNSTSTGPLANRFNWVVNRARSQNSNIKIIASQWWGDGDGIWGSALSAVGSSAANISAYTTSVAAFVKQYGVDGYDIDYEENNAIKTAPTILSQVRSKLNSLTGTHYITVSPSETTYLAKTVSSVSYVNMQTYAGGSGLGPSDFTPLGFAYDQLLYGYCPETNCGGPSLASVEKTYTTYKNESETLAGIHTYRLNSGNYQFEDAQAAKVYDFLH